MIYHNVVRFHVPVHYALTMAKIQGFEKLKDIESNIVVNEPRIEGSEVGIIDVLEDQTRRFALAITNNIKQRNDIRAA
jgi:hypothetical protein